MAVSSLDNYCIVYIGQNVDPGGAPVIEDLLLVLTDRARLQHLSESHQDFSVIILDHRPPRAGKALFGKMLWVMMVTMGIRPYAHCHARHKWA